jgi:hypothetical protein
MFLLKNFFSLLMNYKRAICSFAGQVIVLSIESISHLNDFTTLQKLNVADHHTYFLGVALWRCDGWGHNASSGSPNAPTKVADFDSNLAEAAFKSQSGTS